MGKITFQERGMSFVVKGLKIWNSAVEDCMLTDRIPHLEAAKENFVGQIADFPQIHFVL